MTTPSENSGGKNIVLTVIVFLVLFAMSPTLYEWNARGRIHADRYFELVHNFPTDYNLYLSKIRQGKEGSWLAREKYTSEPHDGSLSQEMYVLIGRLADWAHVQTPYVWFAYHAARVFFAAALLWTVWKVCEWLFREQGFLWQFTAFMLTVTQSTWPKFEVVAGIPRLGGWMPWYTQADSLQRTTFMPHVLLAQMLMIFIFWVLTNMTDRDPEKTGGFISRRLPGNAVFLGIVGLILGIIFPPGLIFIYGVLGIVSAWEFIVTVTPKTGRSIQQWFAKNIFDRFVFGLVSVPSVLYFSLLLSQYPWKRLVEFDVLHPTKFSFVEYFMAVGPLFPLGLCGVVVLVLFRKKKLLERLKYYAGWIAAWLIFLFVFDKIPQQSPTRFTQMAPQIPLGIFTTVLFISLFDWVKEKFKRITPNTVLFIPLIIVLVAFASMASSYMWLKDFVDHKLRATIPLVPHNADVMYPMKDIVEGLVWLQVHTPRSAIVLTGMTTGNYMPVYSGNTAYIGHANTVKLEIKQAEIGNFYTQHLSVSEEMAFLKNSGASYVFYGPEEYEISGGIEDLQSLYPALVKVYENPSVKIYKTP